MNKFNQLAKKKKASKIISLSDMGMIIKNDYDLILIIVWNIFWLWLDYDYLVFMFFDYDLITITLVLAVLIMIRFFLFVRDY